MQRVTRVAYPQLQRIWSLLDFRIKPVVTVQLQLLTLDQIQPPGFVFGASIEKSEKRFL